MKHAGNSSIFKTPILEGLFFVLIGTVVFSLSLPMTRLAAPQLGGWTVGFGRIVFAGCFAGLLLAIRREKLPPRRLLPNFLIVIMGVIFGFPILTSLALQTVPSNHGAVTTGILPIATAVIGIFRNRQRPPLLFWVSCVIAVLMVILFALSEGAGSFQTEDLLLFGAVILAGFGYAEGGRLAREIGGWRVICWAVTLSAPFAVIPLLLAVNGRDLSVINPQGWLGFIYLCIFSQVLGFFAMYRGLAVGGVARVSFVQLIQPFLTLVWSALLLGETIKPTTALVSILVIGNVAFSQWVWSRERAKESALVETPAPPLPVIAVAE